MLLTLLCVAAMATAGTTKYVTDELSIPIRSGKTLQHKILRMVPSGTPVQVLEESDDGYSRVREGDGVEGWALTRYLMDQPSARDRLATADQQLTAMKDENAKLREQNQALGATQQSLAECGKELDGIRHTASRSLQLDEENDHLKQDVAEAKEQLKQVMAENASLRDESRRNWFVAGASVALGGLLLGLILPRIPWRRKRRWDQF